LRTESDSNSNSDSHTESNSYAYRNAGRKPDTDIYADSDRNGWLKSNPDPHADSNADPQRTLGLEVFPPSDLAPRFIDRSSTRIMVR
jgi:hypothetical protein